jgi:hypothetical protein
LNPQEVKKSKRLERSANFAKKKTTEPKPKPTPANKQLKTSENTNGKKPVEKKKEKPARPPRPAGRPAVVTARK